MDVKSFKYRFFCDLWRPVIYALRWPILTYVSSPSGLKFWALKFQVKIQVKIHENTIEIFTPLLGKL
jgi:hypothetical protein